MSDTTDQPQADAAAPAPETETHAAESPAPAQPVVTPPSAASVAPAPSGQLAQDVNHLMTHLGDLKAFLSRFPHAVDGRLGEIVAYLKANL